MLHVYVVFKCLISFVAISDLRGKGKGGAAGGPTTKKIVLTGK